MTNLHITEIIALLGLCLGYLAVTIGDAIAFRIRYGKLTPGSTAPYEAEQAVADAKVARRRRKREATSGAASGASRAAPHEQPEIATPATAPDRRSEARTTDAPDDIIARLESQGIATPIARAAAKHARARLGNGADRGELVREALRACPRAA